MLFPPRSSLVQTGLSSANGNELLALESIVKDVILGAFPTAQRFRCACKRISIERCKSSPGIAFSSP